MEGWNDLMNGNRPIRYGIIVTVLALGTLWSMAQAAKEGGEAGYPNAEIVATAQWLHARGSEDGLAIVDVRTDKHFDGELIPGAIRLPWSELRYNDRSRNLGEIFIGVDRAEEIFGKHGLVRTDEIVLYDSVKRDGGATASYMFWVLDTLGHPKVRVLDGGIDAWKRAGYEVVGRPETREPVLYQAPSNEIRLEKLIHGEFIQKRLGDPMYQIIDVRSHAEYVGEKGTKAPDGTPLALGHIPTAVNVNYTGAWVDEETKMLKSYPELQELYRGLNADRGVIVYCNSGRRSSFSYFVMRLMGIDQAITYEPSWLEWGLPSNFYPVELAERQWAGADLPGTATATAGTRTTGGGSNGGSGAAPAKSGGAPSGGYVSCGG